MRSPLLLLLTVPLFLSASACVPEAARGESAQSNVPVAEAPSPEPEAAESVDDATADHDPGDGEETPSRPAAFLTVTGWTASGESGSSGLVIAGKLENAAAPAIFRLRSENGCARDTKLTTMTTGIAYSVALRTDDLADAFACAIDAESDEASLSPITVTPDATTSSASGLTLDPSIAVVAADLDAVSGYLVRVTVLAEGPLTEAHLTLGGATYLATIAPIEEGSDEPASAFFDVPARAWAAAVVGDASAVVAAKLATGKYSSIVLRPTARIETLASNED